MTVRIRPTRGIRARVAAKHRTPRTARTTTIDRHGLVLDGRLFPYMIGTDVDVTVYSDTLARVDVGIYTERFNTPNPAALPRHATVTLTHA